MNESRRDCLKQMLLGGASLLTIAGSPKVGAETVPGRPEAVDDLFAATRDRRMAWWREARFGMFMHFGLYSVPSRGEL